MKSERYQDIPLQMRPPVPKNKPKVLKRPASQTKLAKEPIKAPMSTRNR